MKDSALACLRSWLKRSTIQWVGVGSTILLGGGMALMPAAPASAAEEIVFTYGLFGTSVPIRDLRTLAETGRASRELQWYLNIGNLKAEDLQKVLTTEVDISLRFIDRVTYSLPGEYVLFMTGKTIRPRSGKATIQAIRGALILSAASDNKISLLEFLENYPTQQLVIDGPSLLRFIQDTRRFIDRVEPVVAAVKTFLEGLVCDCENPPSNLAPAAPPPTSSEGTPAPAAPSPASSDTPAPTESTPSSSPAEGTP